MGFIVRATVYTKAEVDTELTQTETMQGPYIPELTQETNKTYKTQDVYVVCCFLTKLLYKISEWKFYAAF